MSGAKVRGSGDLKRDTVLVAEYVAYNKAAAREVAAEKRSAEEAKPSVAVDSSVRGVRVRHISGWFRVVRVNAKTVTVVTDVSADGARTFTCRYPLVDVVAVAR